MKKVNFKLLGELTDCVFKKELNLKNLAEIINEESFLSPLNNFSKNPSLENYFICVQYLLDAFFYRVEFPNFIPNRNWSGAFLYINPKFKNSLCKNIIQIEFERLYPCIISKLQKNKKINFSNPQFGLLYRYIVDNYIFLRNLITDDEKRVFLKKLINFTYGAISSSKSRINVDNPYLVSEYVKSVFEDITEYDDNIIYMDTDIIYLKELTEEIKSKINSLELPYSVSNTIQNEKFSGIFLSMKTYLLTDIDGTRIIKKVGLREK